MENPGTSMQRPYQKFVWFPRRNASINVTLDVYYELYSFILNYFGHADNIYIYVRVQKIIGI